SINNSNNNYPNNIYPLAVVITVRHLSINNYPLIGNKHLSINSFNKHLSITGIGNKHLSIIGI
ncbi:hypothetical protein GIB67_041723, partial [Kingdonia uniflora]